MPKILFDLMNIFYLRQSLVLLSESHRKCVRGDAMQNAECCLMNLCLLVLRKELWEGSVSACCAGHPQSLPHS